MPKMNTMEKNTFFHKVKYFVRNRQKLVRFSLPTKLHRSPNFTESLKSLAQNQYREYEPVGSHVWLERYDQDTPIAVLPLCEGNIWEFLYSDKWSDCCTLRVTEGELLSRLLDVLFSLEPQKKVLTYTTTAYETTVRTRLLNCMKHGKQREEFVEENLKITFTYYGTSPAGLQRARSHYGHVSAADNIYTILMSTLWQEPVLAKNKTSTPSCKTASTTSTISISRESSSTPQASSKSISISRESSSTLQASSKSISISREGSSTPQASSKSISISRESSSTSQASSKSTDKLSNSGHSQVVSTDSIMGGTIKSATPSTPDLHLEENNLDNTIPDTDTLDQKSKIQIITAIPVPSKYEPNDSHLLSSAPVYIKSMGIFVEPPIDFLSQRTIHFHDEELRIYESPSSSDWSEASAESMASRRRESTSDPQTPDACIMDKKSAEILPDEFIEFESRPQNSLKKTTAEILHARLHRRQRAKAGSDGVAYSPKPESRSLVTSKDNKFHQTATHARRNVERPKSSFNPRPKPIGPQALNLNYSSDKLAVTFAKGNVEKSKRLHNSRPKPIDPQALNLQYSIDKLGVTQDGQKNKEKQRKIGKPKEKRGRAARDAADEISNKSESPVDHQSGYNISFSNLSAFFELCKQDRPVYPTENTKTEDQPLFAKTSPDELKERCINAINDFVVRKEQITSSRGYATVTTVTFNKPFPSTP